MINFAKAIDIAYQAGNNLKPHFGNITDERYKTNVAANAVTKLDEETEQFLEKELKKLDSTIGFKGEEFGIKTQAERFWLADPIDGTGFFIRGVPGCTVMLALIEQEEITASIIYDFVLDFMYFAQKGKGAFVNKQRIHVSNRGLKHAFLYVETHLQDKENLSTYLSLHNACNVLGDYPAGIHFALTAAGKIEGRIAYDPFGKDYDFAPGQLLVQEAGGVVKNIGTNSFDYKNLNYLAVNQKVYKELTSGENPIFPITK